MSGSMSSRARPLRPRRSSRQGFRGRTSLGETHPNVLSPVARLKIRIPASRRPRSHPKWLNARLKADLLARICVEGQSPKGGPAKAVRTDGDAVPCAGGAAQALALALLAAAELARLSHGTCAVGPQLYSCM